METPSAVAPLSAVEPAQTLGLAASSPAGRDTPSLLASVPWLSGEKENPEQEWGKRLELADSSIKYVKIKDNSNTTNSEKIDN